MKIAILDTKKAYLPEINAYIKYFGENGIYATRVSKKDFKKLEDYNIIWKFAGVDIKKHKNLKIIHEYNSLTVGNFRRIKDKVKKKCNIKPDARIFLNNEIKETMNFKDNLPSCIRDMGIAKEFFIQNTEKKYDFVYIGAMDKSRQLEKILIKFKEELAHKSIILIGKPNDDLYKEFSSYSNIIFTGQMEYEKIPQVASKAIYGLNYIPNIPPYNQQTSTKLLEYCALGLKIITTDYQWARNFEYEEKGSFFKIDDEIDINNIFDFEYFTPDVSKYEWNQVLDRAKILELVNHLTD